MFVNSDVGQNATNHITLVLVVSGEPVFLRKGGHWIRHYCQFPVGRNVDKKTIPAAFSGRFLLRKSTCVRVVSCDPVILFTVRGVVRRI